MADPGFDSLLTDISALLQRAESALGEPAQLSEDVLVRAAAALAAARTRLAALEQTLEGQARRADTAVREHPWTAVGVGAALGLLAGYLIGRRRS